MSSGPNISIDVEGFPELIQRIQALSDDRQKKTEITGILKQIASSTVSVARRTAPISRRKHVARRKMISPGTLRKSIGTIVGRRGNARENPTVYVGPRAKGNNNGWYGHFVESGHNVYRTGFRRSRTGNRGFNSSGARGFVSGQFFMKKAYDQTQGKVTSESEQKVARYIQKKIDRLSR